MLAACSEHQSQKANGGARRDRTDDLLNANQALSQLSYGPKLWPHGPYRSNHDALKPRYGFHWPSGGAAKTLADILGFAFVQSNSTMEDGGHGWTRTTDLTLIRRVL